MATESLLDRAGRPRSPATFSAFRKGKKAPNAGKTYEQGVYDPDEILRLLRSITNTAPADLRERALYAFLWRTGVRVSELPRIREGDLDSASGYVRIRATPTRNARDVYLFGSSDEPNWGWEQLRPWLDIRAARGVVKSAPLFCIVQGPTRGDAWSASAMRTELRERAKLANLHGRFHLRGFRNSLAAELYRGNVALATIKDQFGLSTLSSTQSYLEKIGVSDALEDPQDYRPSWRESGEVA